MKKIFLNKNLLSKLCKSFDADFLGIFGSYSRGDNNGGSDLDLLVRFKKRKSLLEIVQIERELSATLGIKIDLITENSVSPYLKDRIENDLEVLYGAKR